MKIINAFYRKMVFLLCFMSLFCLSGCQKGQAVLELDENMQQDNVSKNSESVNTADDPAEEILTEQEQKESRSLWVYVCGAVNSPGVYELPIGARVFEAIAAAGGLSDTADEAFVNQAALLEDGMKLEIYTKEETAQLEQEIPSDRAQEGSGQKEQEGQAGLGLVNINSASKEELMTLPGIGEVKAAAIIAYRESNGNFTSIEGILEVEGIKGKVYEKIQEHITVK